MTVKISLKAAIDPLIDGRAKKLSSKDGLFKKIVQEAYGGDQVFSAYASGKGIEALKDNAKNSVRTKANRKNTNKAILAALSKGWKRRYAEIQSKTSNTRFWEEAKRGQKQRGAIATYGVARSSLKSPKQRNLDIGYKEKKVENGNPAFRVRYTGPSLYTGYFRESVYRDFLNQSQKHISVYSPDSPLVTGYEVNLESFPHQFFKGGSAPYVILFLNNLVKKGVIQNVEEFFEMDDQAKEEIALIMLDVLNNSLMPAVANQLNALMAELFGYKR